MKRVFISHPYKDDPTGNKNRQTLSARDAVNTYKTRK